MPTPQVGRPLPRAADAYAEEVKWWGYILSDGGHGRDWSRVFRVEASQSGALWQALAELATRTPVSEVRETRYGVGCATRGELTFNGRTAVVVLGWFYDRVDDAPRLVTAYPTA